MVVAWAILLVATVLMVPAVTSARLKLTGLPIAAADIDLGVKLGGLDEQVSLDQLTAGWTVSGCLQLFRPAVWT